MSWECDRCGTRVVAPTVKLCDTCDASDEVVDDLRARLEAAENDLRNMRIGREEDDLAWRKKWEKAWRAARCNCGVVYGVEGAQTVSLRAEVARLTSERDDARRQQAAALADCAASSEHLHECHLAMPDDPEHRGPLLPHAIRLLVAERDAARAEVERLRNLIIGGK